MHELRTACPFNRVSIWYYDSASAAYIYIYRNTYCNGTLTANNALTLNSMFSQSLLNLVPNSATAAYIYIYGNSTFTQSILNYVYNSATAAFIDIHGNTYCNGILIANNALTLNSTFTQMILNLLYDSATAAYFYMYGWEHLLQFGIQQCYCFIYIYICLWEFLLQWNLNSE